MEKCFFEQQNLQSNSSENWNLKIILQISAKASKVIKTFSEEDNPFNLINELFGLKADNNDIKQLIKHFGTLKTDD